MTKKPGPTRVIQIDYKTMSLSLLSFFAPQQNSRVNSPSNKTVKSSNNATRRLIAFRRNFNTNPRMLKQICCIVVPVIFSAVSAVAGQGAQRMLYTPPNMTFISTKSGDHAVTVADTSGSIATLQTLINNARASNPTNIIVVTLLSNATYIVSSASLTLDSGECLVASGATIQAADVSVAVPLVQ